MKQVAEGFPGENQIESRYMMMQAGLPTSADGKLVQKLHKTVLVSDVCCENYKILSMKTAN